MTTFHLSSISGISLDLTHGEANKLEQKIPQCFDELLSLPISVSDTCIHRAKVVAGSGTRPRAGHCRTRAAPEQRGVVVLEDVEECRLAHHIRSAPWESGLIVILIPSVYVYLPVTKELRLFSIRVVGP